VSEPDLSRLEAQIRRVLRIGVALTAVALVAGLLLTVVHNPAADRVLDGGLILLIAIPVTRIVASLADAIRRDDRLLAWATAIVLSVMMITLLHALRSS